MTKSFTLSLAVLLWSDVVAAAPPELPGKVEALQAVCDRDPARAFTTAPDTFSGVSALKTFADAYGDCYVHRFYYQKDSLFYFGTAQTFVLFEQNGSGVVWTTAHIYYCEAGCARIAFRKTPSIDLTVHADERRMVLEIRSKGEVIISISLSGDLRLRAAQLQNGAPAAFLDPRNQTPP